MRRSLSLWLRRAAVRLQPRISPDILKESIKYFFAKPIIELAALHPSHIHISVMKRLIKVLLSEEQMFAISAVVKEKVPCKLLVFGLGNDSVFWSALNRRGTTVFIEDNIYWFQKITKRSKHIKAFQVNYNTKRSDWKILLESRSLLDMTLPDEIEKEEWDVILVDAPVGDNDQSPGRMKSIFGASRLIKESGDVFVHDCDRKVEDIYCNRFLKKKNLETEVRSPEGFLRHYHINRSA